MNYCEAGLYLYHTLRFQFTLLLSPLLHVPVRGTKHHYYIYLELLQLLL